MTKYFLRYCCLLHTTTSAPAASALIEAMAKHGPNGSGVPLCRMQSLASQWKQGAIQDHDLLHHSKAIVEQVVKQLVKFEARHLVQRALTGSKATGLLKHANLTRPDAEYDAKELALGRKEELEHTSDPEVADIIAKDHLDEDPHYYSRLAASTGAQPALV